MSGAAQSFVLLNHDRNISSADSSDQSSRSRQQHQRSRRLAAEGGSGIYSSYRARGGCVIDLIRERSCDGEWGCITAETIPVLKGFAIVQRGSGAK